MTAQEISDFKSFFYNNIIIDRFPVAKELRHGGKHADVNVVINVSDEFYLGNSEDITKQGKMNFFFPMGERLKDMGITSMYGALQVLHQIYTCNPQWKVLINCQAGKNRSPTVVSAFYYMMLSEHEPDRKDEHGKVIRNNRLLDNIMRGHLPNKEITESFLQNCKEAFDHPERFLGGMLDWVSIIHK